VRAAGQEARARACAQESLSRVPLEPSGEKKWSDMSDAARKRFAEYARRMCDMHTDIHLHCIVVRKENVMQHIQNDSNKLYNYMIRLSLLDLMATHDIVTMVPDPRAIKVQSGNSLHDYPQIELWFTKNVQTSLLTQPQDSQHCRGIQFTDMLCGLIQSHYEDGEQANFKALAPRVRVSRLYLDEIQARCSWVIHSWI
jgi:Protein of unknown function (DUF3800)